MEVCVNTDGSLHRILLIKVDLLTKLRLDQNSMIEPGGFIGPICPSQPSYAFVNT